ncbi:MAG: glycosyltransferase family 2 protein [Methanobacteriaceae archaeon]|nr:glycosyltransferase family 2 protein [Methanobacteriaceae archaeon]
MINKKVSIIIPVYNSQETISRCLDTILNQTYKNIEIVIVDDGSTDESYSLIKLKINNDPRIKLIKKKNTGVSDSRNYALQIVTGEYITFVDSDDWIELNLIEKMVETLEREKVDIVCCNYYLNYKDNRQRKVERKESKIDKLEALNPSSKYYFTTVWGKLFKKNIINDLQFRTDIFYSEDTLFYIQTLMNSNSIYWVKEILYHYYVNENGAIKNKKNEKFITDFYARKEIYDLYKIEISNKKLHNKAKIYAMYSAINVLYEYNNDKVIDDIKLNEIKGFIKQCNIIEYLLSDFISIKDKIKLFIITGNI